jgi:hypothetical protein
MKKQRKLEKNVRHLTYFSCYQHKGANVWEQWWNDTKSYITLPKSEDTKEMKKLGCLFFDPKFFEVFLQCPLIKWWLDVNSFMFWNLIVCMCSNKCNVILFMKCVMLNSL